MANNQQTSTKVLVLVLVLLCLGSFWFYETKLFGKLNQKFVLINLTKKYFLLHLFLVGCTLFSILFLNRQNFTKQLCWKDLTNKDFLLHLFGLVYFLFSVLSLNQQNGLTKQWFLLQLFFVGCTLFSILFVAQAVSNKRCSGLVKSSRFARRFHSPLNLALCVSESANINRNSTKDRKRKEKRKKKKVK